MCLFFFISCWWLSIHSPVITTDYRSQVVISEKHCLQVSQSGIPSNLYHFDTNRLTHAHTVTLTHMGTVAHVCKCTCDIHDVQQRGSWATMLTSVMRPTWVSLSKQCFSCVKTKEIIRKWLNTPDHPFVSSLSIVQPECRSLYQALNEGEGGVTTWTCMFELILWKCKMFHI